MLGLAIASASMVVLCFRRTYWVELTVGGLVLILFSRRRRASSVLKFAAALAVAAILLGAPFYARLQSFNLFQTSSQFSEDNGDHLDDLLDAWDQLQQSPFLGAGLGMPYPTWRIRNWKSESVMVHNAPIHVWLRYGLCGLVFYLWFHAALFRWLKTRIRIASGRQHAFLVAALAFLVAQFAVSLTFAPWPFSELQSVTLISFLLTGAAVPSPHRHSSLNI
jgi:O-antigen ligase